MAGRRVVEGRYLWARDARRVQVLGGGSWVRLFDHVGAGWHVRASVDGVLPVVAGVAAVDVECAERLVAGLAAAGMPWVGVLRDALVAQVDAEGVDAGGVESV
jgi:hypothetical protein